MSRWTNGFLFKLGLFVCIWYEIAAELRLDGDTAFLVGAAMWGFGWFAVRMLGQAIGLLGPSNVGLLLQAALWAALFWWFAPSSLRAQPIIFEIGIVVMLMVVGGLARNQFERLRARHGEALWRAHSGALVAAVLGSLFLVMIALRQFGSVWPLIGYGLLLLLPFGFGWRLMPRASKARADAKVGDEASFRDAGLSEER